MITVLQTLCVAIWQTPGDRPPEATQQEPRPSGVH
eukprot:CAMPEP_0171078622 /NCGR_PEP_ID=MMETSP0766_2-20121228/14750_1 /TAXON_ID=439317 /ORGANISM="Gambierdiscus australes, Strain CAWD 149" /LENGTH=34 /DNA_ID= /DNA_START= /DNA_END= /DNA_ORIENTATION=